MCKICDDQARYDNSDPPDDPRCEHCAGRGFLLDWTDQGGAMRAVPAETCDECNGSGLRELPANRVEAQVRGLEREAERLRVYWKPMASAPVDGSYFLIERDVPSESTMSFAFWHEGQDVPGWVHAVTGVAVDLNIYTMWRPKPSGPARVVTTKAEVSK